MKLTNAGRNPKGSSKQPANMNTFYLHFFAEIPASISSRLEHKKLPAQVWSFLFPGLSTEVFVMDSLKEINNIKLHVGLDFFARTEDQDDKHAQQKAKNLVESILNIISLEALSSCKPAQLMSLIDTTNRDVCATKFYLRPFDSSFPLSSLVKIERTRLDLLWKAYDTSGNKERIMRSLSWLRKGINSDNVVDEFISYWIALEILQCILRKKAKWDGIKDVFVQQEISATCSFDDICDARQELFHGFHELSGDFIKKLKSYLDTLRRSAIYANLVCLKIDKSSLDYSALINRYPRRQQIRPYSVVKGILKNLPQNVKTIIGSFPKVEFTLEGVNVSVSENEKINMSWKTNNKFTLPRDCTFECSEFEFWGDEQAGVEKADLLISKEK